MNIFIDTNILLSFYHFSKDEIDAINKVFSKREHGSVSVYVTEQLFDEFKRNREVKIKDALKRFQDVKFTAHLPTFMKAYEEFNDIMKLCSELQKKKKDILEKANNDIIEKKLTADKLFSEIFESSKIIKTSTEVYTRAKMRMDLGSPPGKNGSIGDSINWILLLENVPSGEDLYIVSDDGDFYSKLNDKSAHPYLEEEWLTKKSSKLNVYRSLTQFIEEQLDDVDFSFKEKEEAIDELECSGSFAMTHQAIAKLENYSIYTLNEVERILEIIETNSQVGGIFTDQDIAEFLNRVALPYYSNINDQRYLGTLDAVKEMMEEA